MMIKKLLVSIAISTIFITPSKSEADFCYPWVMDIPMVSSAILMQVYDTTSAETLIERGINYQMDAQSIVAAEREIQGSLKSGIKGNLGSIAATLKQHAVATEVDKHGKNFSSLSKTSFACPTELPTELLQGAADKRAMLDHLYTEKTERNQRGDMISTSMKELEKRWTSENAPQIVSGENVLPTDETLSEDQLVAGSLLTDYITNPLPTEKLNSNMSAVGPGAQHSVLGTIKNVRIAPAQKSFSLILGNSAPVYEMEEWLEDIQFTPGDLTVKSKDGKISANAILKARIDARYSSYKWSQANHLINKTGDLRELVIAKSIALEILRRRLEVAQHTGVVLATTLATQMDININDNLSSSGNTMSKKGL